MSAFKSYDFRGIFKEDFTLEDVYKIGYFLPRLIKTNKVLVGRDMRISTPAIFNSLCHGITDSGVNVVDIGLCTTPMVYFYTAKMGFDTSVMITASHNPGNYNGLKFSRKNALPMGYDSGLKELEEMVLQGVVMPVSEEKKGKIISLDVKPDYLEFLSHYKYDLSNLKMVIDCSHGMASILVKEVFGRKPNYLYDVLDGTFPNHEANPLETENVVDLSRNVQETHADIGVIFDGDADRVMFVDETGAFIPPDLMIAVLAHYCIGEKNMQGYVIQDIRTSKSVSEYITSMNRECYIWRVGRAYAALKLREIDGAFGGEFAGHYYFRDFYYSDSAMVAALIILHVFSDMKKEGISVSGLIKSIAKYANSGEINFIIEKKQEAMEVIKAYFMAQEKTTKVLNFDGYRIEFADWWFNIRPSNTEPYLRLIMEARTPELLAEKLAEAKKILSPFIM